MNLFDKISGNSHLTIVDAQSKELYQLHDILFDLGAINSRKKQLVFLYCNSTVSSVGIYLSFLSHNYTIALLNQELDIVLKHELEKKYGPDVIVDANRSNISDYFEQRVFSDKLQLSCFCSNTQNCHVIDSSIKLLLSTSGTTGSPKFVKLSEENILENAMSIVDYLPIEYDDVTPLNLPIFYSYGLSVLHSNAMRGGKIICNVADVLNKNFWLQFDEFGFTSIAGVPFVYEMLDRIGFRKRVHESLRYFSQAGGNLNERTKRKFLDYAINSNTRFYVMYGQTEATARISYVDPDDLSNKITSIGKPIANGQLFIDSSSGELQYKGPNVYGGYAQSREDLEFWENINILSTGDIATKDQDGFFFITGRLKRFVKVFGNRINLDELENFLKNEFDGVKFVCLGIKDKNIRIFTNGGIEIIEKAKNSISEKLKIHSSIMKWNEIQEIPLTSNGKVNYKELEKEYEF